MHPILFSIEAFSLGPFTLGPMAIHAYGVLIGFGMILGAVIAVRHAPKVGIDPGDALDTFLFTTVGGVLGGRLLHVLVNAGNYWDACFHPNLVNPLFRHTAPLQPHCFEWLGLSGGTVWYGGVLGALLAGWLVTRYKGISFWNMADLAFPSVALGHVFGRLGCFMAGCCYGRPTDSWLGVSFPGGSLASALHFSEGWISGLDQSSLPVHPTQLYEAAFNAVLGGLLLYLRGRRRFVGQLTAVYFLVYGLGRGFLEFLRGDVERGFLVSWSHNIVVEGRSLELPDGFSTSQVLSLGLIVVLGGMVRWRTGKAGVPGTESLKESKRSRCVPPAHLTKRP